MPTALYIAAGAIIATLASIAAYLHWQLHKKQKKTLQWQQQQDALLQKKRDEAAHSLTFIAKAYIANQVELAEASIRISHLLDHVDISAEQRQSLAAFDQVAGKLAHIPILKEWKKISKKDKAKHLKTIAQTEKQFEDFALDAAQKLITIQLGNDRHTTSKAATKINQETTANTNEALFVDASAKR